MPFGRGAGSENRALTLRNTCSVCREKGTTLSLLWIQPCQVSGALEGSKIRLLGELEEHQCGHGQGAGGPVPSRLWRAPQVKVKQGKAEDRNGKSMRGEGERVSGEYSKDRGTELGKSGMAV